MHSVAPKLKTTGTKEMLLLRGAEGQYLGGKCCRKKASKERMTKHYVPLCVVNTVTVTWTEKECSPGAPLPSVETAAFREAQRLVRQQRGTRKPGVLRAQVASSAPTSVCRASEGCQTYLGGCVIRVRVSAQRSLPQLPPLCAFPPPQFGKRLRSLGKTGHISPVQALEASMGTLETGHWAVWPLLPTPELFIV